MALFFLLLNNFLHKLPLPGFLAGTMAKELSVVLSSWSLTPFKTRIFSRGSRTPGMVIGFELSLLPLGTLALVSSASIWSSRDRLFTFINFGGARLGSTLVVVVAAVLVFALNWAAMTLSKREASFGAAIAFNCFPRLRMVSWHSANFSEAAVISQSCRIDQNSLTQYQHKHHKNAFAQVINSEGTV